MDRFKSNQPSIGSVNAVSRKHSFTDNKPARYANYYRLKMIDSDGKFEYSVVRTVNNSGSFEASIYPNPVKENLSVKMESEKKATFQLEVIGLDGKVLISKQIIVQPGTTISNTSISLLSAGSYFLSVKSPDKQQVALKFEKQ